LLHIWILIIYFAWFYSVLVMHCSLYCYYCYIAIIGDLAPQVELLSSMRMTPLLPIQQPYLSSLMASIKVIGKLCSGAKNSRMGKLSEKFQKWFRKPWSSIYST
jgi:hypothetical protein